MSCRPTSWFRLITGLTAMRSLISISTPVQLQSIWFRRWLDVIGRKSDSCLLGIAYSYWLPDWISRQSPYWHTQEHITVISENIQPSYCAFCLCEDLEQRRSQHIRLS